MARHRVRIRFRKEGDLRWIGHRDLLRTFERLFRRAGWSLRMSQGFHPKAKMSFPSALAVGIEGLNEVMEIELSEPPAPDSPEKQLNDHAPTGLVIRSAELLAENAARPEIRRFVYELSLPPHRREAVRSAAERFLSMASYPIERPGRRSPIDLREDVEAIEVDGSLRMVQRVGVSAASKPRGILEALGIADLEHQGHCLRRTGVELA